MKHIDNLFRDELGTYTEAPPPMVWDALEKRLEGDRGKRPFPVRWMWYFTVISMVLVVSGSLAWKMAGTGSDAAATAEASAPVAISANITPAIAPVTADTKAITATANNNTPSTTTKHHKNKAHKANATTSEAVATTSREATHTRTHTHSVKHARTQAHTEIAAKETTANTNDATVNSDYDYYAAATSGDNDASALPKAKTETDGYVVNVRTKNRIKVADMTPVDEKPVYRKPVEPTSTESMVVSTMPAETTENENAAPKATRKANTAIAASHKAHPVAHKAANTAKATEVKPVAATNAVAASSKANVTKPVATKATAKAVETKAVAANTNNTLKTEKAKAAKPVATAAVAAAPKANTATPAATANTVAKATKAQTPAPTKAEAPVAKPAQLSQLAAATPAKTKAEAPVVHKVTTPAETAKTEAKRATAKKDINTKAVVKKAVTKQPAVATPATKPAAEKPVACAPKPTEKKAGSVATEKKVTAAQPDVKKEEAAKPVAAIIPSASAKAGKPARQTKATATIPASDIAATRTAAKEKVAKKAEAKEPTTIQPTATLTLAKDVKKTEATKETTAKEEPTEKAIATADKKETKKASAKKETPATTATIVNKAAGPKTFAANAAKTSAGKVYKPSIFVENPATIGMDAFFASAVMKNNTEEAPLPGTFKNPQPTNPMQQPAPAITAQPVATVDSNTAKHAAWKNKITGGLKLGVEGTYSNDGARRIVVSPYMEYKMSDKMSFLLQPAIKLTNLRQRELTGTQSYYKVNDDGKVTMTSSDPWLVPVGPGKFDTFLFRKYTYTQSHDSIVKSYTIGGKSFDFDIPLMMKYNLTNKFSVYGGINLSFHKVGINTNTYNSGPIVVSADSFTVARNTAPEPAPPSLSSVIKYGNTPLSEPQSPYTQPKGELNMGYMVGISYEFRRRCMFDALIHQGFAKSNEVGGYNINTAFSLPYLRLTLGYRLMK